jgi:hypothetical protein
MVSDAMHPGTGDTLQDESGQRVKRGSPTVERVIRCLRTPRGQCPLDPTFGVDMSFVDKAYPDVAARWRAAVFEALRHLTEAGLISDLTVSVDSAGGQLLYDVSFIDVRERARGRQTINLQVRA